MAHLAVILPVLAVVAGLAFWWPVHRLGGGREAWGLVLLVGGSMLVAAVPLAVWFVVKGG